MEQKKELLKSRIEKIHDPVQKRLLQDVLVDVFGELLTYSEDCFAKLEQKIDGERCDPDSHYYIYTGVCKRDGLTVPAAVYLRYKRKKDVHRDIYRHCF